MDPRLERELQLLRSRYPDLEYVAEGRWVHLPSYPLPAGWSASPTRIAFTVPVGFPATPPYGFCVPDDLRFAGAVPGSSTTPPQPPPFGGSWLLLSWTHDGWQPTADPATGSNLTQWVLGFLQRFREGA